MEALVGVGGCERRLRTVPYATQRFIYLLLVIFALYLTSNCSKKLNVHYTF